MTVKPVEMLHEVKQPKKTVKKDPLSMFPKLEIDKLKTLQEPKETPTLNIIQIE